jgi:putative chitinase
VITMHASLLIAAVPNLSPARAAQVLDHLTQAWSRFDVSSTVRQAAFLAQVGHECGSFRYNREIWGPTPAQAGYEGRKDLGNTQSGDGKRFMGRGWLQVTGRSNYAAAASYFCADFLNQPELLERDDWAALTAGWFWDKNHLNALADSGQFEALTRRINGGLNGQADRVSRWQRAKQALSVA